ncbi:hypothetical protein Tco_0039083 [Tanacetum coccineum]
MVARLRSFTFIRAFDKGDHLSPFLFILAMVGLHIVIEDAVQNSQFRGELARCTGYRADSLPFVYLGLLVGERMYQINSWRPFMIKFHKRLANWKSKLMSIGGRLTLAKSTLGSLGIYYLSLFPLRLMSINNLKRLEVDFFEALMTTRRKSSGLSGMNSLLWVDLMESFHDREVGFLNEGTTTPKSEVWAGIVKASIELHKCDFIPYSAIRRKVVNGMLLLMSIGPRRGEILSGGERFMEELSYLNILN